MSTARNHRGKYHPQDCNSIAAGKGDRIRDGFDMIQFSENFDLIKRGWASRGTLICSKGGRNTFKYV